MTVNQGKLRDLYRGFNTLFNKGYEDVEAEYTKIAMIVPSSSRDETYAWLGQMPTLREWIGEREIQGLCANSYTIKNKNFELTIEVPRNDIEDDNIGIYVPLFKNMGEEAKLHPDTLVFELLPNGFENICYDGAAFFSDKHPLMSNAKEMQSNVGNLKLSMDAYGKARAQMMRVKGEHGRSLKIVPDLLVVSPDKEAVARQILFADNINGTTNIYKGTCELMVSQELSDHPEKWYLLCTKRSIRPFIFQEREKIRFTSKTSDQDDNVFFSDSYLYGVNARYNAGYGLWQLAFGSTGTEEQTKDSAEI